MWYDFFSLFYDRALEKHYRAVRKEVVAELGVLPGNIVLDIACGTGQNFSLIQPSIRDGLIVGIDVSKGMLRKARQRATREGWANVVLQKKDIVDYGPSDLQAACSRSTVDCVICTLGLSVMSDWEGAVDRALDLLEKGGRIVLFDAYIEKPVFRTRCANIFAQANLSRKFWEPLERQTDEFRLVKLPGSPKDFGGELFLASGVKT